MFFLSFRSITAAALMALFMGWLGGASAQAQSSSNERYQVRSEKITDLKAVFATVESVDVVPARSRIGGTISMLRIDEGHKVEAGEVIAVVNDPKLPLELAVVSARIDSLRAQHELAVLVLNRAQKLRASGAGSQARLDAASTAVNVAFEALSAMKTERNLVSARLAEGKILAPTAGRVLQVLVTEGTVVMPGETIATVAQERYILRLQLPQRHAHAMKVGDPVYLADRRGDGAVVGRVRQIYPKLDQGRVIADADVPGLGDFFVGERVRVRIGTGERTSVVVPIEFTFSRWGLTLVRLATGGETVIETGMVHGQRVEVLSGLRDGDVVIRPGAEAAQ